MAGNMFAFSHACEPSPPFLSIIKAWAVLAATAFRVILLAIPAVAFAYTGAFRSATKVTLDVVVDKPRIASTIEFSSKALTLS